MEDESWARYSWCKSPGLQKEAGRKKDGMMYDTAQTSCPGYRHILTYESLLRTNFPMPGLATSDQALEICNGEFAKLVSSTSIRLPWLDVHNLF
jgi:hypothetical protein